MGQKYYLIDQSATEFSSISFSYIIFVEKKTVTDVLNDFNWLCIEMFSCFDCFDCKQLHYKTHHLDFNTDVEIIFH